MTDRDHPRDIAFALLEGMSDADVPIDTALLALREAYETLAQEVPGALDGTCGHEECRRGRAKRKEAAN